MMRLQEYRNWYPLLIPFLSGILYLNSLKGNFVYDDTRAILSNPDIRVDTPWTAVWKNDFWGTPLSYKASHKSYRPLTTLTFRWNYSYSSHPFIFHLTNLLLHVITTWLFGRVAKVVYSPELYLSSNTTTHKLKKKSQLGIIASTLVFASHPVHTEAVAGIVGRADVGATALSLSSFLLYVAHIRQRELQTQLQEKSWKSRFRHLAKSMMWLYSAILAAGAAMLTKEQGITVLLICASFDIIRSLLIRNRKENCEYILRLECFWSVLLLSLSFFALLTGRLWVMGGYGESPTFSKADNPTAHSSHLFTRLLSFLYLPVFNFQLLLFPRRLSYDWSMDSIPPIKSAFDPRNLLSFFFYFFLLRRTLLSFYAIYTTGDSSQQTSYFTKANNNHLLHKSTVDQNSNHTHQKCKIVGPNTHKAGRLLIPASSVVPNIPKIRHVTFLLEIAFLVCPFLPATNIFFYVGFVVAERVLYMPSVGYCLLVGHGVTLCWSNIKRASRKVQDRMKPIFQIAAIICVVAFCIRTFLRNEDWATEERLYMSGIQINPPKSWGNLGHVLSQEGRTNEAEIAYRRALTFRSNMADVHYNLGLLMEREGRLEEAFVSYRSAIHFRPLLAAAYVSLGGIFVSLGRVTDAMRVYKQCFELEDEGVMDLLLHKESKVTALLRFGNLLLSEERDTRGAIDVFLKAIKSLPNTYANPENLYLAMAEAMHRNGSSNDAEKWLQKGIVVKPDYVAMYLTYGKILSKNKTRLLEAETWFRHARKIAPNDPSVYHHYGQFLSSHGRHVEAANELLTAASLSPSDYDSVVSAANALRQIGENTKAETFYEAAVTLRPQESRAHMNLGAIFHVNGKYREAEGSYLTALELKPADDITLINLQRLRQLKARANVTCQKK